MSVSVYARTEQQGPLWCRRVLRPTDAHESSTSEHLMVWILRPGIAAVNNTSTFSRPECQVTAKWDVDEGMGFK